LVRSGGVLPGALGGIANVMMKRITWVAVVLTVLCGCSAFAAPLVMLDMSALSGAPGQTVGWGYTAITNDTSFFLVITNSFFCTTGGDPNFTDCTTPGTGPTSFGPQFGTYTDYIAQSFTEVPPFGMIGPAAFSPGSPGFGIGQFQINSNAVWMNVDTGNIFITFDEYNGFPLDGGDFVGSSEMSAPASVLVTPEPASVVMVGASLLALGLRRRFRR
jgi:hypothetical protein